VHPALAGARATVAAGGEECGYLVDAPASAPGDPRPLVLVFHGFGSDAGAMRAGLRLHEHGDLDRAVVVYPEGHEGVRLLGTTGRGWDLTPSEDRDGPFVAALLDRLEAERCVDRRRVYATGFSNGGFFANLLACRLARRLAAAAPVGGADALDGCTPARPVPILLLHGRADDVVPPASARRAREWWAARNGCGAPTRSGDCTRHAGCDADVVHCEGPQAHTWPRDGIAAVWRFFAAHP
jgi:polyhydroxybutyrate depolymerase